MNQDVHDDCTTFTPIRRWFNSAAEVAGAARRIWVGDAELGARQFGRDDARQEAGSQDRRRAQGRRRADQVLHQRGWHFRQLNFEFKKNIRNNILQIKSMSLPSGAGSITSLTLLDPVTVLVGTDSGRIFQVDTLTFDMAILSTCHTSNISDIAFPRLELGDLILSDLDPIYHFPQVSGRNPRVVRRRRPPPVEPRCFRPPAGRPRGHGSRGLPRPGVLARRQRGGCRSRRRLTARVHAADGEHAFSVRSAARGIIHFTLGIYLQLCQARRSPHKGCDCPVHLVEVRNRDRRRRGERPDVALEARKHLRPQVVGDGEGAQERDRQRRRHQRRGGDHDGEQGRNLHHLGGAKVRIGLLLP